MPSNALLIIEDEIRRRLAYLRQLRRPTTKRPSAWMRHDLAHAEILKYYNASPSE